MSPLTVYDRTIFPVAFPEVSEMFNALLISLLNKQRRPSTTKYLINPISYNTESHHVIDKSGRGFYVIEDIKSAFTSVLLKVRDCALQFLYKYVVLNGNMSA